MIARRVLLIDDERLARQRLRQLLASAPDFDVVAECDDARQVPEIVRSVRPDVVFLDIGMPFADGFETQETIRGAVRNVVFVTAHPEHAARAFDVDAVDYLVKPVTQARFAAALDKLRRHVGDASQSRIMLGARAGGAVNPSEIRWMEADGAYVVVHTADKRHVLRESLTQLIDRLRDDRFIRIHRSAAVNLSHVSGVRRNPAGGLMLEMAGGVRLPISRRNARDVVARLRNDGGRSQQ